MYIGVDTREKSNTEVFNTKTYYIKIEKKIHFYVSPKQKEQINLKKKHKWLNVEAAMNGWLSFETYYIIFVLF